MIVTHGFMINFVGLTLPESTGHIIRAGDWLMWDGIQGHDSHAVMNSTMVVVRWKGE